MIDTPGAADRNLLFGILALQMDFISRDQLVAALGSWVLAKQKPLAQVLEEQGVLSKSRRLLLEPLVNEHIAQHDNDPAKSLMAIGSASTLQHDLKQLADPEVQASLAPLGECVGTLSAPLPPSAGSRFRILRLHARGGLGEVFVANDEELNREVALKEIQPQHAFRLEFRSRFLMEAEITGGLEHPGIVPVYGLGSYSDGRPFYAMRFIRGNSLEDGIRRFHEKDKTKREPQERSLALRELLGRFVDVCQAVAYAHSRGVLHRDLKPGNVMLGKYGETLVVDWGLAKATGQRGEAARTPELPGSSPGVSTASPDTLFAAARPPSDLFAEQPITPRSETGESATQMGEAVGTPAYMSPEQAAGRLDRLGPASDVYSLGATLYHLLAGRPPFEQRDLGALLEHVKLGEFPRPGKVDRQVPPALEAICLRAMALDPTERYTGAQGLAKEIERWLADEPVNAYREPWPRRLARWRRRHRTLVTTTSFLVVTVLAAVIFGGLIVGREHRRAHALAQVDALPDASAATVPFLLREIAPQHRGLSEKLTAKWQDETLTPAQRLRIGLALVADPAVRSQLVEMACGADNPDEVLLVRDALAPYRAEMLPDLWRRVHTEGITARKRISLLAILASLDPDSAEWPRYAGATVDQYLMANPLHLGSWKTAFEPIRRFLLPPLSKAFRESAVTDRARLAALAADFAHDQPEVLADLLMDADESQFAILLPLARRQKEITIGRLHRELDEVLIPNGGDAPVDPGRKQLDPSLVHVVETASGLLTPNFCLCQTLPLEQLDALSAGLARSGFRLVNLRPYESGTRVLAAGVWSRDGLVSRAAHGLTAEAARKQDEDARKSGLVPLDVTTYFHAGEERFAVVWGPKQAGVDDARLLIGLSAEAWQAAAAPLQKVGYSIWTRANRTVRGQEVHSGIWWKPTRTLETNITGDSWDQADYLRELTPSNLQIDLRLDWNSGKRERQRELAIGCFGEAWAGPLGGTPWLALGLAREALAASSRGLRFGATWIDSTEFVSEELHGLAPADQVNQARKLASQGFRPTVLSVVDEGGGGPLSGSVWHRPVVPEAARDALARRQAQAAVALLQLGAPERVWHLLEHGSDPRLRSFLIHRLKPLEVDVQILLTRLEEELDVSRRRALLLSLGAYPPEVLPDSQRSTWLERLREWYRDEPDAGLHGAVDWLLRRWGDGPQVLRMEQELRGRSSASGKSAGTKQWMIDGQGHTMVLIPGGAEFWMGSPGHEVGRVARDESLHKVRIPRGYAIGGKTVTVEQFLRFRPDHRWLKRQGPRTDGPMLNVTWYRAAEYCNWLSAQEGLPSSEWCYVPNKDGQFAAGMRLAPNYLARHGYRLPSEAEWEFASRAGAITRRFYGDADELLREYATISGANTHEAAETAGIRKPNDLGMFDIYGNAAEWTQDPALPYQWESSFLPRIDREFPLEVGDNVNRALRGGSFVNPVTSLRSAFREEDPPTNVSDPCGLRVARTYP